MLRQAGACRWVWNWALARRNAYYAENGKQIPAAELSAELTTMKDQLATAWLKEVQAAALQQVLRDLDRAFVGFFEKRAGFPKFKAKKRTLPSFRMPQRVKIIDDKVYVPKIGLVRIKQSRAIEDETKSATFKRNALGHWYVTLVVAFTMPDVALPTPDPEKVVGIDAGLTDFTVLSNGEREPAPKFYRKMQKKLARAQRVFSRRQNGSKRREKARRRIARIHEKIRNQRADFLHKHSTNLIRRFDGVCVEDLNVQALTRTKLSGHAKSFNDAAHGEFRRQLEYKATWHRKHFVAVGRFFPSSKKCGTCGAVNAKLTLGEREWTCQACGTKRDRDLNAAKNIKEEGLRILAAGQAGGYLLREPL